MGKVRRAEKLGEDAGTVFPVKTRDGRIVSSIAASDVLEKLPIVSYDYVFVVPEIRREAEQWLSSNRKDILAERPTEGD